MKNPYGDIIYLPHHISEKRPRMSMSDRAAQFSPFAALVGFEGVIRETGRLTDAKIELGEEGLRDLNRKFQFLAAHLDRSPQVKITHFQADPRKAGGTYLETTGSVKKLDDYGRILTMHDGTKIPMDDILNLEGDVFLALDE